MACADALQERAGASCARRGCGCAQAEVRTPAAAPLRPRGLPDDLRRGSASRRRRTAAFRGSTVRRFAWPRGERDLKALLLSDAVAACGALQMAMPKRVLDVLVDLVVVEELLDDSVELLSGVIEICFSLNRDKELTNN